MAVLTGCLSTIQVGFAIAVNSLALKSDAAAMYADVALYICAVYGESIPKEYVNYKRIYSLTVSLASLLILTFISILFLLEAIHGIKKQIKVQKESLTLMTDSSDNDDEVGPAMIIFGLLWMFFDVSCFVYAFSLPICCCHNNTDNTSTKPIITEIDSILLSNEYNSQREKEFEGKEKTTMNVMAAYAHVAADLTRSIVSTGAGIYILAKKPGYQFADDGASCCVCITIIIGCLFALYEWTCTLKDVVEVYAQEKKAKQNNNMNETTQLNKPSFPPRRRRSSIVQTSNNLRVRPYRLASRGSIENEFLQRSIYSDYDDDFPSVFFDTNDV